MSKPQRRDYNAFSWLNVNRWTPENLLGPRLNQMIFCKICDEYIKYDDKEDHVKKHVAQWKKYLADDRRKAKAARLEAARLAREAKKEEKIAGNS